MKHSQKKKLARKLLTAKEHSEHVPIFLSSGWLNRQSAIRDRVSRHHEAAHNRALERQKIAKK